MTWGYWGIVAGLLILLGVFFLSMEILYARARNGHQQKDREASVGMAKDNKHAA
jgi:hypothetical protein